LVDLQQRANFGRTSGQLTIRDIIGAISESANLLGPVSELSVYIKQSYQKSKIKDNSEQTDHACQSRHHIEQGDQKCKIK
jgi:hypothetical protein